MTRIPLAIAAAAALALTASVALTNAAEARDQIRIVGSSTVFPFATAVAEEFGKTTDNKTPVVESTGSGGGLKLFCAGVGVGHPDITNASRRIKASEVERCAGNGVTGITEVKIGYDGIVLANSRAADGFSISLQQLFLALAKDVPTEGGMVPNPNQTWSDIDASLPATRIEVLGPPPTSGTRDAFVELAMEGGCKTFPEIEALKKEDERAYKSVCHAVREDGAFVEAGENDNLIVQKLEANPNALGIFGYSFLEQNRDKVKGSTIDGVEPDFDTISDGSYPVSRSMYFYVKTAHVGVIPGIEEYVATFTDEDAWGPYGYLADKGLIPLPDAEREAMRSQATAFAQLSM
ncbi:MAG: PstS family phosphate ABC transporter substrate-binding protein [Rhodospirillales bacterium]|nr:PstS family phosphate ABC transporter substrate-binding protein [Rhodospirillales bacterium]MDE0379171.1 PstS family phosphate ABC transporter substrate-binding protein [Rhodospirillales bacterium]